MPLPTDEKLLTLGNEIIAQFDTIFGMHPGFRPAHAKGVMVKGTFTPSPAGQTLTRAPHITRASTPITVRFSNSTGLPQIPDNNPQSNPRGMAIRFHLGEHEHTDIVAHAADGFPTRTGAEFLELLKATIASQGSTESPTPVERFLGAHPRTLAFVQMPKPAPVSFARENYFGVTAMHFTNTRGESKFGRYRITPEAGVEHLSDQEAASRAPTFLFDELKERVARGPIAFRLLVQVAEESDVTDDATEHWPEDRQQVLLGRLELNELVPDDTGAPKALIFDPIPRVDGIEPSADPLLELRAAVYLVSGRRRRSA